MNNRLEELKKEYETITATNHLRRKVAHMMKKKRQMTILKYCVSTAAAFLIVSTIAVNSIPNLAYSMSDIPILKEVVGVLTLGRFETKNDKNDETFYPQVEEFQGELLKTYINQSLAKVSDKYTKNPIYTNVNLDYSVTRNDGKILSVLFTGSAVRCDVGKTITIMDSVNIDVAKSTNEITFHNLVQNTPEAREAVYKVLDDVAYSQGLKNGVEAENLRVYFKESEIVFYYMPLDDSAENHVKLTVPESQIQQYLNTDFGTRPAS